MKKQSSLPENFLKNLGRREFREIQDDINVDTVLFMQDNDINFEAYFYSPKNFSAIKLDKRQVRSVA